MVTTHPGFRDTVHDAQQTFRALLDALARPGNSYRIPAELEPPVGLMTASAAACLTLFDLDVSVWMQPGWHDSVHDWLVFHTGCQFVADPAIAHFALIHTWDTAPALADFHLGTAEEPERSTTVMIQLESLEGGTPRQLTGPGIASTQTMTPAIAPSFWQEWTGNHLLYPLGVDVLLFHRDTVVGLPRSMAVQQF
ncbi:MAG: phosphonate C-P lyase system protein PhnH [Leptolyngbyaceae bacterium]|nr:phosphonate C-P lyase system protein PhnH [Leptolyngbyaceae bacterium]